MYPLQKTGHWTVDCSDLPENTAKKLASYKGRNEHAKVYLDNSKGDEIEYVLCTVDLDGSGVQQNVKSMHLKCKRRKKNSSCTMIYMMIQFLVEDDMQNIRRLSNE